MTTYQMSLILTRSISLDSTFKIALDLRLCVRSRSKIFTALDPLIQILRSQKTHCKCFIKKKFSFFLMEHSETFVDVKNFVTDPDISKNKFSKLNFNTKMRQWSTFGFVVVEFRTFTVRHFSGVTINSVEYDAESFEILSSFQWIGSSPMPLETTFCLLTGKLHTYLLGLLGC
jgi:hypothetical protein